MRILKLRNLTICLCMICVVAFTVATPIVRVSALAQPVEPELAPVFDTQIYQLTDYVEQSMTDPQRGILYLLLGAWAVAQAGTNDYELVDPYTTSDGVTGWLKSTGIQLYNSMLSLQGGNVYDPVTGTNLTPILSGLVGYALGAASLAKNYNSETDFLNDVNSQEHYFVPFDPVLQASINAYYGRGGGLWNWQFDTSPFTSDNFIWNYVNPQALAAEYNSILSTFARPYMHFNLLRNNGKSYFNVLVEALTDYNPVLFVNSSNGDYYVRDLNQNIQSFDLKYVSLRGSSSTSPNEVYSSIYNGFYVSGNLNLNEYDTILDAVRDLYNGTNIPTNNSYIKVKLCDFAPRCFVGSSWAEKQEIFNIDSLNFAQNESPSYDQVPDNTLLDIKGLITSILNNTDLFTVILNNLYDRLGDLITLPDIKVSITLPDDNPLPVNLNDISEIVDNTYLDLVKERAKQASETIGEYVAFWHNCDPEVVYVSLGAILVIAIGAFIGKWGHS